MCLSHGKKTDMTKGWMAVVAAALHRDDGRWLMHQRPAGKHHGGLWEFPGGKVEADEMPVESLQRELTEELGITCPAAACVPAGFAEGETDRSGQAIVILLYTVSDWQGEPQALEGGAVGWFTPAEVLALPKPPLDIALAHRLFQNLGSAANASCQA
jgi:8-oxo-dGTP diphosphatase